MALAKTYIYQISRGGRFLGVLQNVISPFGYTHNINTPAAVMVVTVGQSADTSHDAVEIIQTETGEDIQTETGEAITTERTPDVMGNANPNALIRNNNDIKVYEYSSDYPNGKLRFAGYISRWKANFGGSGNITLNCISYGAELDNFIISGTDTVDVSQASSNSTQLVDVGVLKGDPYADPVMQSFLVGAVITNISGIEVKINANSAGDVGKPVTLTLYSTQSDCQNGTSPLISATQNLQSTSLTVQRFTFAAPLDVTPGTTLYWRYEFAGSVVSGISGIAYQNTDVYLNGFGRYFSQAGFGTWFDLGGDFYFKTYSTGGATSSPFSSTDPATILSELIDSYVSQGGIVNYGVGTIVLTGDTVSYTFVVNTVLEGIKKCLELAPSNYYFYIDPGTNIIYFKPVSTTADHLITFGRHINSLDLEASIETLKNIIYFTGGDTGGGVNLYVKTVDTDSVANNRVGLARIADNRVTVTDTAVLLSQNYLDENSAETYVTQVTIWESTADLTLYLPGDTVGFEGSGTMVDSLLLQIVGVQHTPNSVVLSLGVLPRRATARVEEAIRGLQDIQTINNPSTPS